MVYVQYYQHQGAAVGKVPYLSEVCGDRGVVVLDGRNSLSTMHADAVKFNGYRRPHYDAYRIHKGPSFMDSQPITEMVLL